MTKNRITTYNKLVRDKIPEIISNDGKTSELQFASTDDAFLSLLGQKLVEESQEFIESKDPAELADILEVMLAILHLKKISFSKLEKIRLDKRDDRGGFDKRIILISTTESI